MDISAIINFHNEQLKSVPSIRSFLYCCDYAEQNGLRVEKIAVLDSVDEVTFAVVKQYESSFDLQLEVDHRDLGLSRNSGRDACNGKYIAFFDGDDLWGKEWLVRAASFCKALKKPSAVCHPEIVYYFDSRDYNNYVSGRSPSPAARSFFFRHKDSMLADVKHWKIRYNNLWTSNSLGPRELYSNFPYISTRRSTGFGIEDWAWNAETLYRGVRHAAVPDTVHMVRVKLEDSLGQQNANDRLLPPIQSLPPLCTDL